MNVRSHIYFHINIKLVPVVRSMLEDPWPAADFGPDRLGSLLPKPLHAPALIKVLSAQWDDHSSTVRAVAGYFRCNAGYLPASLIEFLGVRFRLQLILHTVGLFMHSSHAQAASCLRTSVSAWH